jgi:hypothetical protein
MSRAEEWRESVVKEPARPTDFARFAADSRGGVPQQESSRGRSPYARQKCHGNPPKPTPVSIGF